MNHPSRKLCPRVAATAITAAFLLASCSRSNTGDSDLAVPDRATVETAPPSTVEGAHVTTTTSSPVPAVHPSRDVDGHTIVTTRAARTPDGIDLGFHIADRAGRPTTDFDVVHERKLHLIVVSTDLRTYHHVHPTLDPAGTWRISVPITEPGTYRAFADFQPTGGHPMVLSTDLTIPGQPPMSAPLLPSDSTIVAGLDVFLVGDIVAGNDNIITVQVRRDGNPVELEPYLGAGGHLVEIHVDTLEYQHVHPLGHEPDADAAFHLHPERAGMHRLFFDFKVDGRAHTADFTVDVPEGDGSSAAVKVTADGASISAGRSWVGTATRVLASLRRLADADD